MTASAGSTGIDAVVADLQYASLEVGYGFRGPLDHHANAPTTTPMMTTTTPASQPMPDTPRLTALDMVRAVFGGVLMGLANLVPGVSGGTMLLAAGVYQKFIRGVAEVTTFRFRPSTLILLGLIVGGAIVAIVLGAALLRDLVIEQRWAMFSIFIGLTLGGVPIIWRLIAPQDGIRSAIFIASSLLIVLLAVIFVQDRLHDGFLPEPWGRWSIIGMAGVALLALPAVWTALADRDRIVMFPVLAGLVAMVLLSFAKQVGGDAAGGVEGQFLMLFIAGLAGGSAMILPGVSGGYMLLILGQYIVILTAIGGLKEAITDQDRAAMQSHLGVIVPVGLGVVVGIVGVSNMIRFLMDRFERATLGVLLGLLIGAIIGLYPFEAHVRPDIGDVVKGSIMSDETMIDALDESDWPTRPFVPTVVQLLLSFTFIVAGIAVSVVIDRFGGGED